MSTPQDQLLLLARSLSGKGNVTGSDINTLLSPELGYLTGTFYGATDPEQAAADDELLWKDYAPNFLRALSLPDTDIRKIIAGEIYRGAAPWDVKRQIEEYTASQAELNPGLINQEGETSDLTKFADKIFEEYNNYQVASAKAARSGSAKDPFVAGGIPSADVNFAPERLAPDLFASLTKEIGARTAESEKFKQRGKMRSSALEFLRRQAEEKKVREAGYEESGKAPLQKLEEQEAAAEGFRGALSRNLANTPMGRGEAGIQGLVPLYKLLVEQPVAGAVGLFRGITDPIYDTAIRNINFVGRETIGKEIPKLPLGKDPLGQILYGKPREETQKPDDGSFQRAENVRFGRTAQDVSQRFAGVEKDISESAKKEKWLQDFTSALGMLVQAKARAAGYTPQREALVARANFLRAGGLSGG